MLHMRDEILEDLFPNRFFPKWISKELFISSKCYPFEKNPIIANLVGTKTSKSDRESVIELLDDSNAVTLAQPYITIDNLIEQRVVILSNAAQLLDKAITLDKETLTQIAAYRGGVNPNADGDRNEVSSKLDGISRQINIAIENYPDLKSHAEIADVMQQNSYLQKEITAARDQYNDTVNQWNHDIFMWPVKMIVAAKAGYTSRIPFTTSFDMKEKARGTFFDNK